MLTALSAILRQAVAAGGASFAAAWWRPAALALVLAGAFGAGWRVHGWRTTAAQAAEQIARTEAAAESQRLAARHTAQVTHALTQDRLRTERTAAAAAERLRQLAEASRAQPGAAACPAGGDDPGPAVRVLPDHARTDLVQLAAEADAVADRLRACQALLQPEGIL